MLCCAVVGHPGAPTLVLVLCFSVHVTALVLVCWGYQPNRTPDFLREKNCQSEHAQQQGTDPPGPEPIHPNGTKLFIAPWYWLEGVWVGTGCGWRGESSCIITMCVR